jgi:hypothetical protein
VHPAASSRAGTRPASIPPRVRAELRTRLQEHARRHWAGRCREVLVRFRGAFAYVDVLAPTGCWLPMTAKERARLEATPTRLCRLGYLGSAERWAFAFYKCSDETYEPAVDLSGSFATTPEDAFDCAAGVYLVA